MNRPRRVPHTMIANVPVAAVSEVDLIDAFREDSLDFRNGTLPRPITVFDANGHAVSHSRVDSEFAAALEHADIVHADGQFIVWLSRVLGQLRIPERTATTDMFRSFSEAAAAEGLSVYLLGASEEINAECARRLREQFPALKIAGRHHGYFRDGGEQAVLDDINAAAPDLLWVGLGKPQEQAFAMRNRERLNCAWIVTCGGCFHYFTGDYRRAPQWMQTSGLEWLHRMFTGPRYLMRRYAVTVPHALYLVLRYHVFGGLRSKSPPGSQR